MAREANGKWRKGASGNPSGRPRVPDDVREMARVLTREALEVQASIMRDDAAPAAARISAAENIINRAYGKPESNVTLNAGAEFAEILAAAGAIRARRTAAADSGVGEPPAPVCH